MSAADQPVGPPGGGASPALFARRRGEGRPLVLLHGLLVSGELFAPVLDALAARHHLIVPDLRGHGRSAHLPGPDTVEQLADDIALLLDTLGMGQADVLGYSQGGAVAQQFARAHPGRVRRLVLACTYAHNALSPRERLEGWLTPWLLRALGPGRLAALVGRAGGGAPLSPEQIAVLRRLLAANDRRRAVAAYRALLAFDSRGWLGEIAAPTLVVCGAADTAVPRWHAELLARGIRGAELRVVPGAGHFLIWTHPDRLVEHVEEWLARATAQ